MERNGIVGLVLALACVVVLGGTAQADRGRSSGPPPRKAAPASATAERDAQPGDWGPDHARAGWELGGPCHGGSDEDFGGPGPEMGAPGMGPGGPRPGPGRMSPGPLGPGPQGFERLGLTDAQREKLASLRDEELRKAIRTEADLRIAELDLRKLAEDEHPNLQAIGAQVDRLLALRANWMKSRIAGMIAARAVLTPAQRAKLHAPPGGPWGRGGEAPEPPEQP